MKYKPQTKEELKKLVEDKSINLGSIDTSLITDMSELFRSSEREDFSGIETWDVSNVEDMSSMFKGCKEFNQPLNNWNTNKVKDMSRMFESCSNFNQPLDKWDTSNVSSMNNMFQECKSFNQDISNWNVSKVTNMNSMFNGCTSFNQNISNWNIKSVKYMISMFANASSFNQDLNNWDISKVKSISFIFNRANSFKIIPYKWNFDHIKEDIDYILPEEMLDEIYSKKEPINLLCYLFYDKYYEDKNLQKVDVKLWHKTLKNSINKKIISFVSKLEKDFENELKNEIEDHSNKIIFQNIEEAEEYVNNNYDKSFDKSIKFIDDKYTIFTKDRKTKISLNMIRFIYGSYLKVKDNVVRLEIIDDIINLLDIESFRNASYEIFLSDRSKLASRIICGLYGDGKIVEDYVKSLKKEFYPRSYYVYILALNKNKYALRLLCETSLKSKIESIKNAAELALETIANRMKVERYELDDLLVPDFNLDKNGERIVYAEDKEYKLFIDDNMELHIMHNNKELKTAPKTFSKELKSEITFIKKEIKNIVKSQRDKMIYLLMNGRKYSYNFWKSVYIDNYFFNVYAVKLIWNLYDENNLFLTTFRYLTDGSFTDYNDNEVKINENNSISLAYVKEMDNDIIEKWKKQLSDYEIVQPINQLRVIDDLEKEFYSFNDEYKLSNLKNFVNKYPFNEYYEDYYTIDGYKFEEKVSSLVLDISTNGISRDNANFGDMIEIVLKILNISENNKDLVDRFMFGCILMLENLVQ
ncbi:BspA family leucine-rich repeat surface protein [Brachyspira murdochii]|uniref:Lipoprotein n=1 Tax=Brachyspira murdochii (strain ATCC 51284 / DSM 12563 / 56-150) TaxID=526224 RepID=D5U8L6_BRAM5|nr:BspA family leucine-rich repeat surface protein [Brachyspira murdochii]ADG71039.1 lipoprotein [Brachyspira murdochii DSM 12563]